MQSLNVLEKDFAANVSEIRHEIKSFEAAKKLAEDENRDLTIAIVGRVKSGKSSLLNALVFNGENILPQAATPMTAALTFIRYDEKCHADVEFFSKDEWDRFKQLAADYEQEKSAVRKRLEEEIAEAERNAKRQYKPYTRPDITDQMIRDKVCSSEEQLAAVELVEMAKRSDSDISSMLGTIQKIEGVESLEDLTTRLKDYVGAFGRYTPIVSSTTIYLNDPNLKGYRIVDTPGTNDPVISRGKKTTDNLRKADVVIIVSPAFRFFDHSDLGLCTLNLPGSGIKNFLLLISQFDVSIGEVEHKVDKSLQPVERLKEVIKIIRTELVGRYRRTISEIADKASSLNAADSEKWTRLRAETPICVSSMAYVLAKHWDNLSEKEQQILKKFNDYIPGLSFTKDLMEALSMMDDVHNRIAKVREQKNEILSNRKHDIETAFKTSMSEKINEFYNTVKQHLDALETKDLAQLESEISKQTKLLEGGRSRLNEVFEDVIANVEEKFSEILSEMQSSLSKYSRISIQEESHQTSSVQYQERRGVIGTIIDWFAGPQAITVYHTHTTRYANVYNAIEQIDAFVEKARCALSEALRSVMSEPKIKILQNKLCDAAFDYFESVKNLDVDPDVLKRQIKSVVKTIKVPDPDLGNEDYSCMITRSFSGSRVNDEDLNLLHGIQRDALQSVMSDLKSKTQQKMNDITTSLRNAQHMFVDQLIEGVKAENEKLIDALKNKTATCERWHDCLGLLRQHDVWMQFADQSWPKRPGAKNR